MKVLNYSELHFSGSDFLQNPYFSNWPGFFFLCFLQQTGSKYVITNKKTIRKVKASQTDATKYQNWLIESHS